MKKASKTRYSLRLEDKEFERKIYSLDYIIKHNSSLDLRGKIINIKPSETFLTIEKDKDGNYDIVLDELKTQARKVKRSLSLPINESYLDALSDDPEGTVYKPYLEWLEKTIIELSNYSKPEYTEVIEETSKEDIEKSELKDRYFEVFGKKSGNKSIETMKKEIEDYK